MIENIIALIIIILIVGGASAYIYKNRKKGVKCIGCPASQTCNHSCPSCSNNK